MNRFDGRKLDHKTLEELRIRAVQRVEAGESPEVVIKALGFTRARIYEWISKVSGKPTASAGETRAVAGWAGELKS